MKPVLSKLLGLHLDSNPLYSAKDPWKLVFLPHLRCYLTDWFSFDLLKKWEKVFLKIHVVVNEAEQRQICTSEVLNFIPSCCTSFSPTQLMGSKIRAFISRSGDISVLDLKKVAVRDVITILRDETSERNIAVITILRDETSERNIAVIFIIGMGGVGNITWAKLVYNDE